MIYYVKGNLLDSDCDYICHQVNCQGVMNSGVAKQIREKWPNVYASYAGYCSRHLGKRDELLGTIWGVLVDDTRWIVNMFSQNTFGYDGSRYTSYDAFAKCLETIRARLSRNAKIAFPKNIGCGLGGGNWKVISALIEEILGEDYEVYIYELEETV